MTLHAAEERNTWMLSAACKDFAGHTFFPATEGQVATAKAICRRCPVRRMCLETALRNRERHGVWGGLTEQERRRLRRPPGEAA
ncbi:MAG: WhiB family transcriptional regulator [Acidimicrobiales bacterium]